MAPSTDRFVVAGTLGVAGIALVQLSSTSEIDRPLLVTSFSLAVAVPTLTLMLMMIEGEREPRRRHAARYSLWVFGIGVVATWVALTGLFWHLHALAGLLFIALSIASLGYYMRQGEAHTSASLPEDSTMQ